MSDSIKATLQSFDVHHASEIAQLDHKVRKGDRQALLWRNSSSCLLSHATPSVGNDDVHAPESLKIEGSNTAVGGRERKTEEWVHGLLPGSSRGRRCCQSRSAATVEVAGAELRCRLLPCFSNARSSTIGSIAQIPAAPRHGAEAAQGKQRGGWDQRRDRAHDRSSSSRRRYGGRRQWAGGTPRRRCQSALRWRWWWWCNGRSPQLRRPLPRPRLAHQQASPAARRRWSLLLLLRVVLLAAPMVARRKQEEPPATGIG